MEELEELEDIKLYDEAIKAKETSIPIDEAFKMIEAKPKSLSSNTKTKSYQSPAKHQ
jgi:hypothetical protein